MYRLADHLSHDLRLNRQNQTTIFETLVIYDRVSHGLRDSLRLTLLWSVLTWLTLNHEIEFCFTLPNEDIRPPESV